MCVCVCVCRAKIRDEFQIGLQSLNGRFCANMLIDDIKPFSLDPWNIRTHRHRLRGRSKIGIRERANMNLYFTFRLYFCWVGIRHTHTYVYKSHFYSQLIHTTSYSGYCYFYSVSLCFSFYTCAY